MHSRPLRVFATQPTKAGQERFRWVDGHLPKKRSSASIRLYRGGMGHGQVDSTYWYIHVTPHMLAQVSEMSETFGEGGQS
jgi:hypothetical protein